MSLERFRCALALAASMLGPGLPAAARAAVAAGEEPLRVGVDAALLRERPQHTASDAASPRLRLGLQAQVPFLPNLAGVVGGAWEYQDLGEGAWGRVREFAVGVDAGLRVSLTLGDVNPFFQTTFGLAYTEMRFGEAHEEPPVGDDDPATLSPHIRTALGIDLLTDDVSPTRVSFFVGLDAAYYSYTRSIDLGYMVDDHDWFDFDIFDDLNESRTEHWKDGRLSPSVGFEVAFAP